MTISKYAQKEEEDCFNSARIRAKQIDDWLFNEYPPTEEDFPTEMKYIQTPSDKKDERLLRQLLTGNATNEQADAIMKNTFSDLIKWTLEDVTEHLVHVFNFTPGEVDLLIERYPMHIPTHTQTMRRQAPMPTFKKNSERVINYAQNLWKARKELNETKKLLSTTALSQDDYPNQKAFDSAVAERLNINSAFVDINKYIDAQLENAHQYIQGGG
tara:strand:- start:176 stop:817 length:642 start_codon:yes stop_codon:yes gene_type:complete